MAGTLTISTLSDGTNSTSATNCVRGPAKAFVNFHGGTTPVTIRNSYNISSVTRNATGNFTIAFTTSFASGDAYTIATAVDSMGLSAGAICTIRDGTVGASSFGVATGNTSSATNPVYVYATCFA